MKGQEKAHSSGTALHSVKIVEPKYVTRPFSSAADLPLREKVKYLFFLALF